MNRFPLLAFAAALLLAGGCATNPVTGERELSLVGEDWERSVGEQQYAPLRQAQGGDFLLDPGLVDYVQDVGQRVASVSDRELPYEFEIVNESVPNAWALPGGKIAINRGLLMEMDSEAELAAVLGHEVVHAAARHGAQQASRGMLLQGAVLAGGIAAGQASEDGQLAQVALLGGMVGAQLINQSYSREAEREADRYGMIYMDRAGYNPRGAVELQETFLELSEGRTPSGFSAWLSSHPPSQERVENNRELLAELGDEGIIARERYQDKLSRLRRAQPAYEAYDEGRKAFADKDFDTALAKANEAIRRDPAIALSYSLKGDVLAERERYRDAERAYSQALQRNSAWFYHYLKRGMVRHELGRLDGARTDLEASNERIPTAVAHFYLGNIARERGNRQDAIEHYRVAAQSQTEIGQRARAQLQQMGVAAQ
ncbi:MAG: M48 family metalloprotease [Wenzhouxiangellaceae bacterium]|nr:M48 family metalloprotease [Wenzhouxiangellaceae bacterium]